VGIVTCLVMTLAGEAVMGVARAGADGIMGAERRVY